MTNPAMPPILEVRRLGRRFGGVIAVNEVSFALQPGEIIGLIGPNGAGKTTLINLVTGVLRAGTGTVLYQGQDVTRQAPFEAARRGIARTFQIVQPFPAMTVAENVAAGALFAGGARTPKEALEQAHEHLKFVGLDHEAERMASALNLPARKRLELAKSLAMHPKLLLLDEVNAGLNAVEIDGALELMSRIAARGVTILIIEHLLKVVFTLCSRVLVLHHGVLIADGVPRAVAEDQTVIEAYLGTRYAARLRESAASG